MFERYTEPARHVLFFARCAVSEHGGAVIEPVHLLLGLLRADPQSILRFAYRGETSDSVAQRIAATVPGGAKLPTSAEIPFSTTMKKALEHACVEADDLSDASVRPEHLLLGVLAKGSDDDRRSLRESGVEIEAVRKYLHSTKE